MRGAERRHLSFSVLLLVALTSCTAPIPSQPPSLLAEFAQNGPLPRSTVGRLSIAESYLPCDQRTGQAEQPRCDAAAGVPPRALIDLAMRASRAARATGDPEAFHVAGLMDLLWRDTDGIALDRAVKSLEQAVRLSVRPSAVLSDLSAAYLMRFDTRKDVRDLLAALEMAERSGEGAEASPASQFTRAMVLQRLELVDAARTAWNATRTGATGTPWSEEAGRYVSALDAQESAARTAKDPQAARLLAIDSLLPRWGTAFMAGDSARAAASLQVARTIGAALEADGGDHSVAMMVEAIHAAPASARRRLARAHQAYGVGVHAFTRGDYLTGRDALRDARRDSDASPVLAAWAQIFFVSSVLHSTTPQSSIAAFTALTRTVDRSRLPALAARAHWGLATSLNKAGRQIDALSAIRESQALFARIGESEYLGATLHIEAFARVELREGVEALEVIRRAVHQLRAHRSSVWLHNILWVYARAASDAGFDRAAHVIATEAVRVADRRGDPRLMTESRLARARYGVAVGRAPGPDLDSAATLLAAVPQGAARDWQEADLLSLRRDAGVHSATDSTALDQVVDAFRRVGTPDKLVPALLARAAAAIRAGRPTQASEDLNDATAVIDRARRTIVDTARLNRSSEGVRDAWRQLARFWIAIGQPSEALLAMERSRPSGAQPVSADRGGARTVPPNAVVTRIAFLGDSLATWTLVQDRMHFDLRPLSRDDFRLRMQRLRARVELGLPFPQLAADLIWLYDAVLRTPLRHAGANDTTLTIVADDDLTSLPLAAAFDTVRRQYAVARHSLRFAGSVGGALRARSAQRDLSRVLAIGDPAFSAVARPALPRLAGARAEVADVRAQYRNTTVLVDDGATVHAVRQALPGTSMLHFAGHARFDVRHPDRSELVLAAGEKDAPDFLRASEVRSLALQRVQLVVLSACESASAGTEHRAGANGLVQAFLGAGVGGVVGSMWRIDDEETRVLMSAFHRAYRRSGDAADALRRAQVQAIQAAPGAVAAWSAFKYQTQ